MNVVSKREFILLHTTITSTNLQTELKVDNLLYFLERYYSSSVNLLLVQKLKSIPPLYATRRAILVAVGKDIKETYKFGHGIEKYILFRPEDVPIDPIDSIKTEYLTRELEVIATDILLTIQQIGRELIPNYV